MNSITDYKLHIKEGDEKYITKYSITIDALYFDFDSLIRLYGREAVEGYIKQREISNARQ